MASAIQVYEVYKVVKEDTSEEQAIEAVTALQRATIVPLDEPLALEAADISLESGLAMADAIICATALRHSASVVTMDTDFGGFPNAVVITA